MFKIRNMDVRKLLLISSSNVCKFQFLEYAAEDIKNFLKRYKVQRVLFIPYAQVNRDAAVQKVSTVFKAWDFMVESTFGSTDPVKMVKEAQAIFIGGGNTFLLLRTLYENNLIEPIRERVLKDGIPFMGSSAGSNVATPSICTTNDMPIVYPPTFEALNLIPFNINPHYLEPAPDSDHRGETREERINEFLTVNPDKVVLGMREGVHLIVEDGKAVLRGIHWSKVFKKGQEPVKYDVGADVTFLLQLKETKQLNETKQTCNFLK